MSGAFLILGCGYTASRVARLLLEAGSRVICTARNVAALEWLAAAGAEVLALDVAEEASIDKLVGRVPAGARALLSIPPTAQNLQQEDGVHRLLDALKDELARVVYLSTTGVYGRTENVTAATPVAPETLRQAIRVETERRVEAGPWEALILRPAAIYGPWRGVHDSIRRGAYRLTGDGSNSISRIHVDDLAAIACAALQSSLTGAFPVGDEEPAPAAVVAAFCCRLLGAPMPSRASRGEVSETLRYSRKVDGSEIRRRLGVHLRYPTYKEGIPAAIAAEEATGVG